MPRRCFFVYNKSMNKKLVVTNALMYLILIFIAYFGEAVALFSSDYSSKIGNVEHILFFVSIVIMLIVYFFLERKNRNLKPSFLIISVMTLLVISNIVAIFVTPLREVVRVGLTDGTYIEVLVTHTHYDQVEAVIYILLTALCVYLFMVLVPRKFYSLRQLRYFFVIFLIFVFFSYGYSLIVEFDKYVTAFDSGFSIDSITAGSFFTNVNVFGLFSIMGMFIVAYLYTQRHRFYYHFFFPIMLFFTFASSSQLCVIIGVVFYLLFYVAIFFTSFNKKTLKRNVIILSIVSSLLLIGIITFVTCYFLIPSVSEWYNDLMGFVYRRLFDDTRVTIWRKVEDLISGSIYLIFGRGIRYFNYLLSFSYGSVRATLWAHNGFLEVLGQGGIIWLTLYLIFYIYVFYVIIRLFAIDKRLAAISLITFISITVHGIFESTYFFDVSTKGLAVNFIVLVPTLGAYYHARNRAEINELKYHELKPKIKINPFNNLLAISNCFSLLIMTILGSLIGSLPIFLKYEGMFPQIIYLYVSLFILALSSPYIIYTLARLSKYQKANLGALIFYLLLVVVGLPSGYFIFFNFLGVFIVTLGINLVFLIIAFSSKHRKMEAKRYFIDNLLLPLLPCLLTIVINITLCYTLNLSTWTALFALLLLGSFFSISVFLFTRSISRRYHNMFNDLMYTLSFKIVKSYQKQLRYQIKEKIKPTKVKRFNSYIFKEVY